MRQPGWPGAPSPTVRWPTAWSGQCCRLVPVTGAEVHSRFGAHAHAGAAVVTTEEVGMKWFNGNGHPS